MNMLSLFRRRGPRPAWLVFGGIAAVLVAVVFLAGCAGKAAPQLYHCPMHPDYVSDKPGDCPICGMRLVPMKATAPKPTPGADKDHQQADSTPRKDVYTCPMHPEVQADKPGECPKCGMDLVKKAQAPEPEKRTPAVVNASASSDLASVHTEEGRAEMAGVRTAVATTESVVSAVRAVGTVVPDETRVRHVTTKVEGWVEKLYVNTVGQTVRAGQPLFELYSPELLASQEEYLRARQSAEEFARSSLPEVRRGGEDLASSARRRLELFDVPPEFLRQLDRTGKAQRTIVFRAPFSGYVSEKTVLEGHKVEPGMDLLTLTDLSRVWVAAQLYEAEANAAQLGRPATVTLPYDAGTSLRGRVSLVYPTIETESRTIKVRLEFPNPRLVLKPGMFVNVALEASRVTGVVVPDSAVIDSGTRQVVFVETGPGHFEPREVQVGLRVDGKAVVLASVRAGERVAVAANFLLDSESRLRGAVASKTEAPAKQHK
jgi:RND family efflux transporter MFP subunit